MNTALTKNSAALGAAVLVSAVALTACSSEGDTAAESIATSTTVVTLSSEPDAAQPQPTSSSVPEQEAPAPTTNPDSPQPTAPALPELKDALATVADGDRVTVLGDPSTICIYGDGFGTNVWAGNDRTSCEFVRAVSQALTDHLNPTYDNIRDNLQQQVFVESPVTGEEYVMTCVNDDPYVRCRGGDGAAVYAL